MTKCKSLEEVPGILAIRTIPAVQAIGPMARCLAKEPCWHNPDWTMGEWCWR